MITFAIDENFDQHILRVALLRRVQDLDAYELPWKSVSVSPQRASQVAQQEALLLYIPPRTGKGGGLAEIHGGLDFEPVR